jgi:hypothetical protein
VAHRFTWPGHAFFFALRPQTLSTERATAIRPTVELRSIRGWMRSWPTTNEAELELLAGFLQKVTAAGVIATKLSSPFMAHSGFIRSECSAASPSHADARAARASSKRRKVVGLGDELGLGCGFNS